MCHELGTKCEDLYVTSVAEKITNPQMQTPKEVLPKQPLPSRFGRQGSIDLRYKAVYKYMWYEVFGHDH